MIHVWLRMMLILGLAFVAVGCGGKKAEPAPSTGNANVLPDFRECENKPESEQRRCNVRVHKKRIDFLATLSAPELLEMDLGSEENVPEGRCGALACADLEQFIARLNRIRDAGYKQCGGRVMEDIGYFIKKDRRHFSDTYVAPGASVAWQARVVLSDAIFACRNDVGYLEKNVVDDFTPVDRSERVKFNDKYYCKIAFMAKGVDVWILKSEHGEQYPGVILRFAKEKPFFDGLRDMTLLKASDPVRNIWAYASSSRYWGHDAPISGFDANKEDAEKEDSIVWAERLDSPDYRLIDTYILLSHKDHEFKPCK